MAKGKKAPSSSGEGIKTIARNKRAFHEYEIVQRLECGIALVGTEVKSLREGKVNFADSYACVEEGELVLLGMNISEYTQGNRLNHDPVRKRKLLAHKREIAKLAMAVEAKGLTLIPLSVYWLRGRCKVELGLARGKARHDKRESLHKRDFERQKQRILRHAKR